jgi:hypothetical protein
VCKETLSWVLTRTSYYECHDISSLTVCFCSLLSRSLHILFLSSKPVLAISVWFCAYFWRLHHLMSQINRIHLRPALVLSPHLRLCFLSALFHSHFWVKFHKKLPLLAVCPAHLVLVDLTTLTLFGKQCKLWSSSLHVFAITILLGRRYYQIVLSTHCSLTLQSMFLT